MRISGWSSDVCSSDLSLDQVALDDLDARMLVIRADQVGVGERLALLVVARADRDLALPVDEHAVAQAAAGAAPLGNLLGDGRSEEHTSELQSLMRISYAVFCLKKKKRKTLCRSMISNSQVHKSIQTQ